MPDDGQKRYAYSFASVTRIRSYRAPLLPAPFGVPLNCINPGLRLSAGGGPKITHGRTQVGMTGQALTGLEIDSVSQQGREICRAKFVQGVEFTLYPLRFASLATITVQAGAPGHAFQGKQQFGLGA